MRRISDVEMAIADRFFFALQVLAERKVIRGLQTFTRRHGINYGNMNTVKNHRERLSLKTEHLAFLAQDYGVSCEWLLLGNGEMFLPDSPVFYGKKLVLGEKNASADMPRMKDAHLGVGIKGGEGDT